jgi:hypothetical protein
MFFLSWVQAPNRPEKKNKKSKFCQAIRNQNQIFHGFNPVSTTETSGLNFPRAFERPELRVLQKTYEITPEVLHTENVGKKQLLLSCQISPLFWHRKFYKPEM